MKFFRFNTGLAAILLIVAAFRSVLLGKRRRGHGRTGAFGLLALDCAKRRSVIYWATVGRMLAAIRPAIVGTGVCGWCVALVARRSRYRPGDRRRARR